MLEYDALINWSPESQINEEISSVTGDTADSGWLPLPRPDFGSQPLTDRRREVFARAGH